MSGIKVCIITIILTALYLVFSVLISNILFYNKANGSLIKYNSHIVGSNLLGQSFKSNIYFQGRPSANNYKNDISGSSNFSYYSKVLQKQSLNKYDHFLTVNYNIKPDLNLITESASGLDPHITYEGAISQAERISKATGISKENIIHIINKISKPKIGKLFGERILNVLEANLEIKKELHAKAPRS